jgi:hypothetical protein
MSFADLLQRTVTGYRRRLGTQVPDGPFRSFALWATAPHNPRCNEWLDAFGITQVVRLTSALLESSGAELNDGILQATVPLNVYFAYELSTDNLEMGLATSRGLQVTLRRQLVLSFNTAMEERLRNRPRASAQKLQQCKELASRVSCFEQMLVGHKYQALAQAYAQETHSSLADLEFAFWPQLIGNIESCNEVADSMPHELALRTGLINRYRAVSALLRDESESVSQQVRASADTILVAPTLIYYALLLEADTDRDAIGEAAFNAAVLVRLLNDLGSPMLLDDAHRALLFSALERVSRSSAGSLRELLEAHLHQFGPLLVRLHKDLVHGEFNLGLHRLSDLPATKALPPFVQRIEHLAHLYRCYDANLSALLPVLPQRVNRLIGTFVRFHETLYANPHYNAAGEYSV